MTKNLNQDIFRWFKEFTSAVYMDYIGKKDGQNGWKRFSTRRDLKDESTSLHLVLNRIMDGPAYLKLTSTHRIRGHKWQSSLEHIYET